MVQSCCSTIVVGTFIHPAVILLPAVNNNVVYTSLKVREDLKLRAFVSSVAVDRETNTIYGGGKNEYQGIIGKRTHRIGRKQRRK